MKVYFISGLAADSRAFQFLKMPGEFEAIYINWVKPGKNESLESYAQKLSQEINYKEKFILVGLSMGGMLATEIAKIHPPVLTILLSSVPTPGHFPPWFKIADYMRLYKIVPARFFKSASLMKRLFTSESKEVKNKLREIIRDSDAEFIRWALEAILHWKNQTLPKNMIQIHGSKDELLPIRYTKPDYVIQKGSHLMVMSRADEINELLKNILNKIEK